MRLLCRLYNVFSARVFRESLSLSGCFAGSFIMSGLGFRVCFQKHNSWPNRDEQRNYLAQIGIKTRMNWIYVDRPCFWTFWILLDIKINTIWTYHLKNKNMNKEI